MSVKNVYVEEGRQEVVLIICCVVQQYNLHMAL